MNYSAGYVGDSSDHIKILRFEKQREERRKEIEDLKKHSCNYVAGTREFASSNQTIFEQQFGEETAGLFTRAEFIRKRRTIAEKMAETIKHETQKEEINTKHNEKQYRDDRIAESKLSFSNIESGPIHSNFVTEELSKSRSLSNHEAYGKDGSLSEKKIKTYKNPSIDTSFLPDQERDRAEEIKRDRLHIESTKLQNHIKNEPIEIVYSYWDGIGHRRKIIVRKGNTVGQFLSAVQKQLAYEFREIQTSSADSLMYVKEDIILPHHYTFFELIFTEARGKSGPLFEFGVKEDIRIENDATKETDASHAGKVVERHWYSKNKHIFPACRWELYDSHKKWTRYTLHDEDHALKIHS